MKGCPARELSDKLASDASSLAEQRASLPDFCFVPRHGFSTGTGNGHARFAYKVPLCSRVALFDLAGNVLLTVDPVQQINVFVCVLM